MPVFVYRAADRRGQTIDGVMEARDAYFPMKVAGHAERGRWFELGGGCRVGQRDLLAFTQQLATLFEAGLPLDRALAILEELAVNARLKAIVGDLLVSVPGGRPLRRLAEFLEAGGAFTAAVVSALAYPAVIFAVGIGAVVFLMTFVIPRFATIFADLGQAIPLPTRILLAVSAAFQAYWWAGLLAGLAGVLAWRVWTSSPEGRLGWDRVLPGLPVLGRLSLKVETARFARTLGTMLKSGVPVMGALAVVGDTMTNQALGRAVSRLADGVKRGGTLAAGLQERAPFPPLAIHLVRVGEETGRLQEMALNVADTFETDVRTEMKRALGLLEPAIILGMGVLVAFIVVAMLLAIFSINEIPL